MVEVKNVCIVENDQVFSDELVGLFEKEGFHVQLFRNSKDFHQNRLKEFRGLYIISWQLPDEPGIEIINHIRLKDSLSSIFVLSKYIEKNDAVECFRRGADDYIRRPISADEVFWRGKNNLSKLSALASQSIDEKALQLIPEASSFIKSGKTVSLTKREFIIFNYLYDLLDKPVSRDELILQFSDEKMTTRNIDVHIFSLRKKIKEASLLVETVWGLGYKLSLG